MKVLKEIVLLALIGAAVCAFFKFGGDFSWQQSVVLTMVAVSGYGLYKSLSVSQSVEKVFEPFRVSVFPDWYNLLSDFKLLKHYAK